jgi:hypothetical protein
VYDLRGKNIANAMFKSIEEPEYLLHQYSGQFLKRDAMPSASNAYAIQQRSEKSECNLNQK